MDYRLVLTLVPRVSSCFYFNWIGPEKAIAVEKKFTKVHHNMGLVYNQPLRWIFYLVPQTHQSRLQQVFRTLV